MFAMEVFEEDAVQQNYEQKRRLQTEPVVGKVADVAEPTEREDEWEGGWEEAQQLVEEQQPRWAVIEEAVEHDVVWRH